MVWPLADRFFELRFESIGGLGAHAAGQILATAAVLRMSFNASHFSSYGSEKKGSPVRSFIRLGPADRPIRTSAPIETPDAIVIFHAALVRSPLTIAGIRAQGTLIYNAPAGPVPQSLAALPHGVRVIRVDALGIASMREMTAASNFAFLFVALTILVAELGGGRAAVATALSSALSLDFFLTRPYLRLTIADKHDIIAFVGLATCGLIAAACRDHPR